MGKGARKNHGAAKARRAAKGHGATNAAPAPTIRGSYPPAITDRLKAAVGYDGGPYHDGQKKAKKKGKAPK